MDRNAVFAVSQGISPKRKSRTSYASKRGPRCALNAILSTHPTPKKNKLRRQRNYYPRANDKMTMTKSWSGPLDDVMVEMVGEKLVALEESESEDEGAVGNSCIVN